MNFITTRLIHWKNQWPSLVFWMILPILMTWSVLYFANTLQENTNVPIGVVLEENTPLSMQLYESIETSPLVNVYERSEREALYELEKHQLDSVFIIHKGFEENIRKGNRNRLITSFRSDESVAYHPVKEMVISLAQEETSRSKAAHIVANLSEQMDSSIQWTWDDITKKSKEIQSGQQLLQTSFTFSQSMKPSTNEDLQFWSPWELWALFTILSTFLLFDWVIKERSSGVIHRFAFTRMSFQQYLIGNLFIYTIVLLLFDVVTVIIFDLIFQAPMAIIPIVTYRLMVICGAFLLALTFRSTYLYTLAAFAITFFLTIISGIIVPLEGIASHYEWIDFFNPLQSFLANEATIGWLILFILIIAFWFVRKEFTYA
ncbi:MAG TPA: ABC transporter permease [Bacillota bacterium]|nr:ABC transporter permease [Bacillota bacterium]